MAAEFILISPFKTILSHSRFLLTLRSQEGQYHSLILFRLSSEQDREHFNSEDDHPSDRLQLYAMEANCPHLGADLSHAEIEDCETGVVAVCPWHRGQDMILIFALERAKLDSRPVRIPWKYGTTTMGSRTYGLKPQEEGRIGGLWS
ncbi:hypothetical protein AcV7_005956 [Taiwanofungus camphoratus]|nr:hypothetical protein AcV7_005956 [Antrodia cinnamomea]